MSQGLQLLSSLLSVRSRQAVSRLSADLFTEEELPKYQFIANYYQRYDDFPTLEVCAENGVHLSPAERPFDYYLDRVRKRQIASAWNPDHREFVRLVGERNVEDATLALERMLRSARLGDQGTSLISLQDAFTQVMEEYDRATDNPGLQGITFGWDYVDALTLGQTPGDVSVFVARPGMGKSQALCHLAVQAWRAGHSVLFVTMEMTVVQIARRILGLMAGINPRVLRQGMADQWTEQMIHDGIDLASGSSVPFHFVPGDLDRSVPQITNLCMETRPDIVFIDAAYLLSDGEKTSKYTKSHEVVGNVLKGIKQLALRRNIPVTISVQFNREAEKSGGKGSNIAGSDDITKIASNIFGMTEGQEPHQKSRRTITPIKVREDSAGEPFEINFLHAPPNFEFIGMVGEDPAMRALTASM
jgi:hypothetical protein